MIYVILRDFKVNRRCCLYFTRSSINIEISAIPTKSIDCASFRNNFVTIRLQGKKFNCGRYRKWQKWRLVFLGEILIFGKNASYNFESHNHSASKYQKMIFHRSSSLRISIYINHSATKGPNWPLKA